MTDRAEMLARARALQAKRDPASTPARPTHASSKIIATGVATSATLLMVAAMAAAGQAEATAPPVPVHVIERVIVVEVPAASPTQVRDPLPAADAQVTVVREVRTLPAPATDPSVAPAATQGS